MKIFEKVLIWSFCLLLSFTFVISYLGYMFNSTKLKNCKHDYNYCIECVESKFAEDYGNEIISIQYNKCNVPKEQEEKAKEKKVKIYCCVVSVFYENETILKKDYLVVMFFKKYTYANLENNTEQTKFINVKDVVYIEANEIKGEIK